MVHDGFLCKDSPRQDKLVDTILLNPCKFWFKFENFIIFFFFFFL